MYPCIPEWTKIKPQDPFDYKLRAADEVAEEHKYYQPDFNIRV